MLAHLKTLPESQRTQDIESKTWIISKRWNKCRFQFSTLSLPPLLGNHLSHLVHLPVILFAHHHLNDNCYLPMHCSHNIYCRQNDHSSPAPIFHATPVPPPCQVANPLGDLQAYIGPDHHLNDNHQPQIALLASSASIELVSSSARVISAKFQKRLVRTDRQTPRPDPRKIKTSKRLSGKVTAHCR